MMSSCLSAIAEVRTNCCDVAVAPQLPVTEEVLRDTDVQRSEAAQLERHMIGQSEWGLYRLY